MITINSTAYPFSDNFEAGLESWIANGGWGLTTAQYASPNHAVTDSPGTFYTNSTDAALTLASSINLSGAVRPAPQFYHKYAIEPGYDFALVEVSTNNGVTWINPPLASYTGNLGAMTREQLDLSPYAGSANVRIRFRLVTDDSVVMDGWYVDDVLIAEAPAPGTLAATQTNRNSVALAWTQSTEPGFAAYRLYRSLSPGVDWRTATLVGEISNAATTNFTDITACPKTKYYYRLAVVNTNGLLTLGNEIAVTTHPGMDYPFVDNGEGGPNIWIADAPWTLSDEDAASPSHAWSDSPGTNYANGIASQSLTLVAPLYLAGKAVSPVLSFNHEYAFAQAIPVMWKSPLTLVWAGKHWPASPVLQQPHGPAPELASPHSPIPLSLFDSGSLLTHPVTQTAGILMIFRWLNHRQLLLHQCWIKSLRIAYALAGQ